MPYRASFYKDDEKLTQLKFNVKARKRKLVNKSLNNQSLKQRIRHEDSFESEQPSYLKEISDVISVDNQRAPYEYIGATFSKDSNEEII